MRPAAAYLAGLQLWAYENKLDELLGKDAK